MRCPYSGRVDSRVVNTATRLAGDGMRRYATTRRVMLRLPLVDTNSPGAIQSRREPSDGGELRRGISMADAEQPITPVGIDQIRGEPRTKPNTLHL